MFSKLRETYASFFPTKDAEPKRISPLVYEVSLEYFTDQIQALKHEIDALKQENADLRKALAKERNIL